MRRLVITALLITAAASGVLTQQQRPDPPTPEDGLEREAKLLRVLSLDIATFGEPYYPEPGQPQPQHQFRVGDAIWVHVTVGNGDSEVVVYGASRTDPHRHYSPQLSRAGQAMAYLPEIQKKLETTPLRGSGLTIRIWPYRRERVGALKLQDWYGTLEPGFYEMKLGYGFRRGGPRLTSDAVAFEVVAR